MSSEIQMHVHANRRAWDHSRVKNVGGPALQ